MVRFCDNYCLLHHSLQDCLETLLEQVQLDYMRTMNKISFDKMIRLRPEKFAFVQPQDPEMRVAPETGKRLLFLLKRQYVPFD